MNDKSTSALSFKGVWNLSHFLKKLSQEAFFWGYRILHGWTAQDDKFSLKKWPDILISGNPLKSNLKNALQVFLINILSKRLWK